MLENQRIGILPLAEKQVKAILASASFGRNTKDNRQTSGQRQLWRSPHENSVGTKRHNSQQKNCFENHVGNGLVT